MQINKVKESKSEGKKKKDSNIRHKHLLGRLSRCFISRRVLVGDICGKSKSVTLQKAELRTTGKPTGKPHGHGS